MTIDERRQRMLTGAILPTMLGLAWPTVIVLLVQTAVGVAETYYVSNLGTDALAGVAMVFPALMLMQMMSNGGIGGGVSAAIARALGARRKEDADALVLTAVAIAVGLGALFSVAEIFGGRWLFTAMGGQGGVLAASRDYADVVFAGSILIWLTSLLAAALRGAGNVRVPALVTLIGAIVIVPLSPALIFGWGPLPRLGVAGAGVAVLIYYAAATIVLLWYLRRRGGAIRLPLDLRLISWRLLGDVFRVGGLAALSTVQMNLTVALVTGLVGRFGADEVAGYGVASRLDYLLIPLVFGLGTAALTMVGTNIGAGNYPRARRIGWTAGLLGGAVTEAIGLFAAFYPRGWLGLFTAEPAVLATGAHYFHLAAPSYGLVGMAMLLYFAGQGAGTVFWPVVGGTARLVIAGLGGWLLVTQVGAGLEALFIAVLLAAIAYGGTTALAMWLVPWRPRVASAPAAVPAPIAAKEAATS